MARRAKRTAVRICAGAHLDAGEAAGEHLGGGRFLHHPLDHQADAARQAELLADQILEQLVKPFSLDSEVAQISGSIGIAFFPDDGDTVDGLASKADNAMYMAKDHGGNQFHFYQPADHERGNRPGDHIRHDIRH